jgi:hypothetical protein
VRPCQDNSSYPPSPSSGPSRQTPGDAGDILIGGKAITQFLRLVTGDPDLRDNQTYHWVARGFIPVSYLGTTIVGSKRLILQSLRTPTNQAMAAAELANMRQGERTDLSSKETRSQVISKAQVQRATAVKRAATRTPSAIRTRGRKRAPTNRMVAGDDD